MPAATSLVELILKKWGDDIAGAAKELEEKVGFPESVANRIATGELPMDAESVAKRAQDQGYGETMLHGSSAGGYNRTHDIKEIDPEKAGDKWGQDREGFFLTNDPVEANYYATTDSVGRTVDGTVYPLRYKSDSPKVISSTDDIDLASEQPVGYWDERHGELISEAKASGNDSISLLDYGPYEDKSHKMTVVLDPNNIRSPNAAFDPEYTGSNIMGNATVPMLATTAALAAAPAVVGGVFQHNATKEPVVKKRNNQSSLLESVTDFNDEVIESVKHAAGPLSLLMPYEGINDYLKVVNDNDKQPTWMDRLGLLDF
jgi:hypothetical protein